MRNSCCFLSVKLMMTALALEAGRLKAETGATSSRIKATVIEPVEGSKLQRAMLYGGQTGVGK
jgi:hypothetical protein